MAFNNLMMDCLEGKKVSRPPVWLMRQAGRYMEEYRAIRKKIPFLQLCKNPELARDVTLQPINAFGFDAAILFSDILIPVEAMGVSLEFNPAPVINSPVKNMDDVDKLNILKPERDVPFVIDAVKLLVKELNVPLIGFAGSPFTVACYVTGGSSSKNFLEVKRLMYGDEKAYASLMNKLSESTLSYLKAQIAAGCSVVQIFDTWAGILSTQDYNKFVYPYVSAICDELKGLAHVVYFPKDSSPFYDTIQNLNVSCIGVDWKIELKKADSLLNNRFPLQGNMDPAKLFASKETIKQDVMRIVSEGRSLRSHIFNLGHGILPETPVDNVKYLVDLIKGDA